MSSETERLLQAVSECGLEEVPPELESDASQQLEDRHPGAHIEVKAVLDSPKAHGLSSKWLLFLGIALAAYFQSLANQTIPNYLPFAASGYSKHSLISTIEVAQCVVVTCMQPVIAQLAEARSRAQACILVLTFFVLGYINVASSHGVNSLVFGCLLYTIGDAGLPLLMSVIIAEITTLKWRGALYSLTHLPFIINAFIAPNVAAQVLNHLGWRWGYGISVFLVFAFLAPLIVTLLWMERNAMRLGLTPSSTTSDDSLLSRGWMFCQQLDLIGLILMGASVALILLPLTLAINAKGGWHNPSMIAMVVVGCVLIPITALWEIKFAKRPFLARRLLVNRTVALSLFIVSSNQLILVLTSTYLYSFILVTKPWSLLYASYVVQTHLVSSVVSGILGGLVLRWLHKYKSLLIFGTGVLLVGVASMVHSCRAQGSFVEIVWTQIVRGISTGSVVTSSYVSLQATVPHIDLAITIALASVSGQVGHAIGGAVAGAIWTNTVPQKLAEHLPNVNATYRAELFGSMTSVTALPYDDPIRQGVISAYSDGMNIILVAAMCLAVIPFALSFFIPDRYLGDTQNAVDTADGTVEPVVPFYGAVETGEGEVSSRVTRLST